MQNINNFIGKLPAALQEFLRYYKNYNALPLSQALDQLLTPQLAAHCYLVSYQHGQLRLTVDQRGYYSQLYYRLPELTRQLKRLPCGRALIKISCSLVRRTSHGVRPNIHTQAQQATQLGTTIQVTRKRLKPPGHTLSSPSTAAKPATTTAKISTASEQYWRSVIAALKTHHNYTNNHSCR